MNHRGAGSGSAGLGLSNSAFVNPQFQFSPRDDLHKSHIDPVRKTLVGLNQRPQGRNRCRVAVVDHQNRVGVTHRQRAD